MKERPFIKVAIVEDDTSYRRSLKTIIEKDERFRLYKEYDSGQAFIKEINSPFHPDVCLVDVVLGDMSGLECCKKVKAKWPAVHLVVMTAYPDAQSLAEAREIGADYIEKGPRMKAFIRDVISTVKSSEQDEEYFISLTDHQDDLKIHYVELARQLEEAKKRVTSLSENQHKVLQLKRMSKTAKEIAVILNMTESTVQTHMKRGLKKLQLPSLLDYLFEPVKLEQNHIQQ